MATKATGSPRWVEILSAFLPGVRPRVWFPDSPGGTGHFFLALDVEKFRPVGEFAADLDAMIGALHDTPPLDRARPVLVAGDPEHAAAEERKRSGIPLTRSVVRLRPDDDDRDATRPESSHEAETVREAADDDRTGRRHDRLSRLWGAECQTARGARRAVRVWKRRVTDDPASRPAVSVVIPTHQRRELVRGAIASVLAQTFRDFEVIVIDDGSTDGSEQAVRSLGHAIRYAWQENRGVSAARNAGIALARGDVVAFLDSDDRWLPNHLALTTDVLARHPAAVLSSTSPRFEIAGRQAPIDAEVVDALPELLVENLVGNPSGVAVRRQALLAVTGFDERLRVMEGWDLWLRLALVGKFALLRHRTIVFHSARGSLTEESARNGEYLRALDLMTERIAALEVGVGARNDGDWLRERVAGLGAYIDALRAFGRDDAPMARTKLAAACAALPALSREPQLVANRLALLRFGAAARLGSFASAAAAWPDPRADTALYLRLHAIALAVRLGRGSEAATLLRGWPIAATPGFLARNVSVFSRVLRRRVQRLRGRG